ncbi:TonB-dependent receptor [Flavobacterium helocola]
MPKYFCFFICFYLHSLTISSQEIKGIIKDHFNYTIHLANVQLINKDTNKTISFTQTNENGEFVFKTDIKSLPLKLKITHISYEMQEILIEKFNDLNIVLQPRITELKEVIVEHKTPDIVEKKDTLLYNLNNLLVGSELKLSDVIKKLPGLSIDSNKKIRFNGNILDHILIDGDEFFRDNHQLATENITAEMIDKIELLKNYQDLSSLKGFENSGENALNIKIKKNFKDNFKGNIDIEGGVKERYKTQGNVFNFGGKSKFHLIANSNNLNENIFSPLDYLELRKITGKNLLRDKLILGQEVTIEKDIPSFVFAQDNINKIDSRNVTLNFTKKPNEKKRIELVTIFNKSRILEKNQNLLTYLDNNSSNMIDDYSSTGNSIYNSSVFKFQNKLNENSFFQTNFYLFLSLDKQNQDLNNLLIDNQEQTLFKNKINLNSTKTGFNVEYKTKLSEKLLFESVLFNDYNFSKTEKVYQSNKTFDGFNHNDNYIEQFSNFKSLSFGLKSKATYKFNKSTLDFKFISTLDNESLSNINNINSFYNFDDDFLLSSNSISTFFSSDITKKLKYNINLDFTNNNHESKNNFKRTINVLLPKFNMSYKVTSKTSCSIGYNLKINNPNIYNFISGNLVENQRTTWLRSNLISEKMLADNINTSINYIDITKSIFFNFSISYSNNRKQLATNFNNDNLATIQEYQYIDFGNSTNFSLTFDKKFKQIPLGLGFSSNNSISYNKTISNNIKNNNRFNQNNIDFNLKSYFKNKPNFDIGIIYLSNFNQFETEIATNKSELQTYIPYIKLEGTLFNKKINWKINSTYNIFDSSSFETQNIFDLSTRVQYTTKKKISIYFNANNLLNIRDNNLKNNFLQTDILLQETSMNTLSGFANFGINYSF